MVDTGQFDNMVQQELGRIVSHQNNPKSHDDFQHPEGKGTRIHVKKVVVRLNDKKSTYRGSLSFS
jgi:hypothetical protein